MISHLKKYSSMNHGNTHHLETGTGTYQINLQADEIPNSLVKTGPRYAQSIKKQ